MDGMWAKWRGLLRRYALGLTPLAALVVVLLVGVLAVAVFPGIVEVRQRYNARATLMRGTEIVRALEAYHGDWEAYPLDLEALVPAHLSAIPRSALGSGDWDYGVFDGGRSFSLMNLHSSSTWHDAIYTYHSDDGEWMVLDTK